MGIKLIEYFNMNDCILVRLAEWFEEELSVVAVNVVDEVFLMFAISFSFLNIFSMSVSNESPPPLPPLFNTLFRLNMVNNSFDRNENLNMYSMDFIVFMMCSFSFCSSSMPRKIN